MLSLSLVFGLLPLATAGAQCKPKAVEARRVDYLGLASSTTTSNPNRDGGSGGILGGHRLIMFADTQTSASFVSNSIAYVDPNDPLRLHDFNEPGTPFIPQAFEYTASETTFNDEYDVNRTAGEDVFRLALWPNGNIVPWNIPGAEGGGPNVGVTFGGFDEVDVYANGSIAFLTRYTALLSITAGDSNYTTERVTPEIFSDGQVQFGCYSALTSHSQDGYLYVFGFVSPVGELTQTGVALARAPVGSVSDNSTYEYYYPSSASWSPDIPSVNAPVSVLTADGSPLPYALSDGDVFWSPHHSQYLNVYQTSTTGIYYVQNSTDLIHWSLPEELYQAPSGESYNYAGHALPGFLEDDATLLLQWTQQLNTTSGTLGNAMAKVFWK